MSASARLCVLVADDEKEIRLLLQHWLRRAGHLVTCAASGDQAARLMKHQRFDLVVTDVVMPDGDGYEVIAHFRRLQPHARIVAVSGGGQYLHSSDCLKLARGLGAHATVMKPFTWEKLQAGITDAFAAAGDVHA